VRWSSEDATDLDYTPLPLVTRTNNEKALQFTQEVRIASGATATRLSDIASVRWQGGVFVFTNGYDQSAVNRFSPFVLNPALGFTVNQHSPDAALDDSGVGLYGQGTISLQTNLEVTVGARVDHEKKSATLDTFFDPAFAPAAHLDTDRSFSDVSPQFAVAYRLSPGRIAYATVGRGYKAGGFNAASPPGTEAFGEEHTWQVEGGTKTSWASGRMLVNVAVFHIKWDDLQLNVPNPAVPAQFYVANVGGATSSGAEFELTARAAAGLDVFGTVGATRARFGAGSRSSGVDVSGHDLPTSPGYTATFGAQYSRAVTPVLTLYGRGESVLYGSFFYDDFNSAKQDAYGLLNLRAGLRSKLLFGEVWIRNATNSRYIPIAFPYSSPSGFVGEMGAPRTVGLRAGVTF